MIDSFRRVNRNDSTSLETASEESSFTETPNGILHTYEGPTHRIQTLYPWHVVLQVNYAPVRNREE